jgi:immune inhibitor A
MPPNPYAKTTIKPPRFPITMNRGIRRIGPVLGERKALVILVDFDDNQRTYQTGDFDSLIYGTNQSSMRDYYSQVSYGKFTISAQSDIAGWFRAPESCSYYVGDSFGFYSDYPNNVQRLVERACELADPSVDFSEYDGDSDGYVDAVFIVHAGPGAEETGSIHDIWSHQWQLSNTGTSCPGAYLTDDGVRVDGYSMEPERLEDYSSRITVGVFAHEFGHVLGLPDLYDTDYSTNGLGWFCLMAAGSWGRAGSSDLPGSSPSYLCAWAKYQLGWTTPVAVERSGVSKREDQLLVSAATNPVVYRLMEDPGGPDWTWNGGAGEYFLVENRYRSGYDRSLPGNGLLILHADDSRTENTNESHPLVGIMQADGDPDYLLSDLGVAGDLWSNDLAGFGDGTTPSSRMFNETPSGVSVYDIGPADSVVTASFWIAPILFGRTAAYPNPFLANKLPSWGKKIIITYYPSDTLELTDPYPLFKVSLFNIAGELVRVLDNEFAGEVDHFRRSAFWDLKNDRGQEVVSGMYLYVIETEGGQLQRTKGRLTLIR